MQTLSFPYGKTKLEHSFDEDTLAGVLVSGIEDFQPEGDGAFLVRQALEHPIGSDTLCNLAKGKQRVVIIASDHTRPVPSRIIIPEMLRHIRMGNPNAEITILIATGCHRGTTKEELIFKFGREIVEQERICIHDCTEADRLVSIGTLPSGGSCQINSLALEADLLVAEGFIEPHFFAGFSGGRKSVLPGIAGRTTVLSNHCAAFIHSPNARTGILEGNPIHADMLWAARTAKLAFIVNVVLNSKKEIIHAVAGDMEDAHRAGTDFLKQLCSVPAAEADIVISTNGGYPLDQNVYQAVKGMTAAEATVKKGGVIIMLASSTDGTGGDHFYHQLADEPDIRKTMDAILRRPQEETLPDQWEVQILLRILLHASVIYVSELEDRLIEEMHMIPAHSIGEALQKARQLLSMEQPTITAIIDGVSLIVKA